VVGPFGAALIATGSNARLGFALSHNGFFPRLFNRLSKRDVPLNALMLGFAAGVAVVLTLPFTELVALNSATVVLSFCIGPLAILALRRQLPDRPRPFRLPLASVVAPAGFIIAALVIYWCGFATIWRLDVIVALGIALFLLKLAVDRGKAVLDLAGSRWLFLLLAGITFLSWAGSFGGRGYLAFGIDMLAVAAWAVICFRLGLKDALAPERTREYVQAAMEGP
jgi:amino acid transporter